MTCATATSKRIICTAIFSVTVALCFLWLDCGWARQPKGARISLLLATGLPGSVDYQVGLGLASLWTTRLKNPGIRVSAAISEGVRENIEAIRIADADLMISDEFFSESAFSGKRPYKDRALTQLRAIGFLWPELLHILIRSEKLANGSIQDLEGLTLATGLADSASKYTMEHLIRESLGPKKEIKIRPLSNIAALEAWKAGTVQALTFFGGLPLPTVNFFAQHNQGSFSFLDLTESEIDTFRRDAMPNVVTMKIPAGSYMGQDRDVQTLGQNAILVTSSALDQEVVYSLTKTMFENLDYLAKIHPACAHISLERAVKDMKIPFHPGAVQYYTERNITIPDELRPE